jgi:disulfide oxidoreductase YuzD
LSKICLGAHFPENKFWERCPAENYANLVTQFVSVLEKNKRDCWFQEYGATVNTAKVTEAWLSRSRASLLAATISRSYATSPFSFFYGGLSLEKMK